MVEAKPIQAVLVLYQMSLQQSHSYQTLSAAMVACPQLKSSLDLLVVDNSPEPQSLPSDLHGIYLHDGRNPGLAERYNEALSRAQQRGASWLLLLDQDTSLDETYLLELLALATKLSADHEVVAIVPKLLANGRIESPRPPRFQSARYGVELTSYGVLDGPLWAFNSGALMRTSAVVALGGFPPEYWLDYLDHATFEALQRAGGRVFVMRAALQHDFSEAREEAPASLARLSNKLRAEARFYRERGTRQERLLRRFDLLRQAIGHGRRGRIASAMLRLQFMLRL